jgi:tRNA1Val (adenine37-N6)-methyltransferase
MANSFFKFKQFIIHQDRCAMKVTTDGCLFGAWVAENVKEDSKTIRKTLDIGTGTGLLSLMLAQKIETTYISAIEIEKEAAFQALENMESSPWKNRMSVLYTDIKSFAPLHKFDLIFSNPPFYEKELQSPDQQRNIAHHSAGLSLEELLTAIGLYLEPDGNFFLLLPHKRKDEIDLLVKKHSLCVHEKVFVSQSTGHSPFRIMIKGGKQKLKEFRTSEIAIVNENQQYTSDFTELLKDYYLKL